MEPLYQSNITCICCETVYQTSKVRPSFKRASGYDSDFCGHYKNGINPDFYVVRVCPSCGFAVTENGLQALTDKQRADYYERVGKNWKAQDYCGERNAEEAMACYKLALLTAQVTGVSERVIAGLLHHIAWLYRYEGNKEDEKRFLTHALAAYIRVFETEGVTVSNARLMFLIGELNKRIGEYGEAIKWFNRVVNDKKIMDSAMIRASREQWQLIREEMEEARRNGAGSAGEGSTS